MERLAAQLAQLKNQLLICQDPEERQRLTAQFRQLEIEIRTAMEAARARIQQADQENANMRAALEKLQRREQ
jgi:hypothetical protein